MDLVKLNKDWFDFFEYKMCKYYNVDDFDSIVEHVHNPMNEAYKEKMAEYFEEVIPAFFNEENLKDKSSDDIYQFLIENIVKKCENLIDPRHAKPKLCGIFEDAQKVGDTSTSELFKDFYMGNITDREFFDEFTEIPECSAWLFVSYFMYTKCPRERFVVNSTHIDAAFKRLNVRCPQLAYNVSYDNYCNYVNGVNEVYKMLKEKYPTVTDLSKIDADSFIWIMTAYTELGKGFRTTNRGIVEELAKIKTEEKAENE